MNLKIKFRESFRPFAPSVPTERASDYFELDRESPYMLLVAPVGEDSRPTLPAVTHVDGSARVQTVSAERNPRFHQLLSAFERLTGRAVLVNTSFNVRGEPIVCTPADAYRCFMKTGMDHLVLGGRLLHKSEQPAYREASAPGAAAPAPAPTRRRGAIALVSSLLSRLYRAWMTLASVLGWINTRIVFGAAYVLLVVPYGIAFRFLGKSPLDLRFDPRLRSYRKDAEEIPPARMDRPY
jgi:Carbamoyltransferase C-terminus/Saxitoxin biosynthesis operon protein SxtJ